MEVWRCVVCLNNTPQFPNSAFNGPKENKISANNSQGVFPALPGLAGPGRKFQRQGLSVETPAVRPFPGWKMLPRRSTSGAAAAGKTWNEEYYKKLINGVKRG